MSFDYLKQKRILLVDDEQELLDMVISILNKDGFENIRTAKTVAEAISVSDELKPELAILDVMLPDGNGFDIVCVLRDILLCGNADCVLDHNIRSEGVRITASRHRDMAV